MRRMSEGTDVLVVDAPTVRRLLPMPRCIEVMEEALAGLARDEAVNPLRSILGLPYNTAGWRSCPARRPIPRPSASR